MIGCLLESLVAPEDPQAVLARIAHEDARIVSLTVTEKGYCHDPASGQLNLDHPDIVHDLGQPPRSAIGYLAWGLQRRRAAGRGPLTLMSLDNLPANGHLLRGMVLAFAEQVDAGLARWIAAECTFPCSMVDRIVPRTTDADREAVARALGLADAWPVMAEPYLEWVLEDSFAAGRPDWRAGGARFVAGAAPFDASLRNVNGAHSALAYLSVMAGWDTVDQALAQPALRRYLERLMRGKSRRPCRRCRDWIWRSIRSACCSASPIRRSGTRRARSPWTARRSCRNACSTPRAPGWRASSPCRCWPWRWRAGCTI